MINSQTIYVSTSDLEFPEGELWRAMGYGEVVPDEDICTLALNLFSEALSVARPSYYYKVYDNIAIEGEKMRIEETEFTSGKTINGLLRRSSRVAMFVATAGEEFQKWMDDCAAKGEILNTFIIDAIGTLIVECTGDYIERTLEAEIANEVPTVKHTNRFSPGYCGWRIEEQHQFFAMLPENICGIELNDSSLMHPIKSISGVIGIGEDVIVKKYGCAICKRTDCYMRKK
ncbi:MAG: vitamin B12 dependent-methionine synthase activation domain-containing protein [Rikenellaceae bacterium]